MRAASAAAAAKPQRLAQATDSAWRPLAMTASFCVFAPNRMSGTKHATQYEQGSRKLFEPILHTLQSVLQTVGESHWEGLHGAVTKNCN
eukprot:6212518-Pleurochrysis_carterae.AAC.1